MFKLLPHQVECFGRMLEAYRKGSARALVEMACGLGKTVIAIHFIDWLRKKLRKEKRFRPRILVLADQEEHLQQAKESVVEQLGDDHTYGFFIGQAKDLEPVDILYATFQTMRKHKRKFRSDAFDLIVVDEAHHSKANTYEKVLKYFTDSFLLGLTATPDRMDLRDIREIFGAPVYSLPLPKALARGELLAKVDYRVMFDKLGDFDAIREAVEKEGVTLSQLNKLFFVPRRDEEIADEIVKVMAEQKSPKVMVFCPNVKYVKHFAGILARKCDGVTILHNELPKKCRKSNLADFKTGKKKVICSVDMLNESVDVPEATILVFLRSTQSYGIFVQQLGRGLRLPFKGRRLKTVTVLDFVGSWERLRTLAELQEAVYAATSKRDAFEVNAGDFDFRSVVKNVFEILESASPFFTDEEVLRLVKFGLDAGLAMPIRNKAYCKFYLRNRELGLPSWPAVIGRRRYLIKHGIEFAKVPTPLRNSEVLRRVRRAIKSGLEVPIRFVKYKNFSIGHRAHRLPSWNALERRKNYLEKNGINFKPPRKTQYSNKDALAILREAIAAGLTEPINNAKYVSFRSAFPKVPIISWSLILKRKKYFEKQGIKFERLKDVPRYADDEILLKLRLALASGLALPLTKKGLADVAKECPKLKLPSWEAVKPREAFLKFHGFTFREPAKRYDKKSVARLVKSGVRAGFKRKLASRSYERFRKTHPELNLPSWPVVKRHKPFLKREGISFAT